MEFSPPKRLPKQLRDPSKGSAEKNQNDEDTKPVLILKPFSAVPHVSFDKVKLGCIKTSVLYVFNPLDVDQVVRVEKFPSDKGFSIENGEFYVKAGEESTLKITWAPVKATSFRETVAFRSSSGIKNQAYLLGTAYSPVKKVQQKKTTFKSRTGVRNVFPGHFAAKNEFSQDLNIYDEKKENLGEKEFVKFEPRVSFCLKTIEELPDSPIRRQTYTINSMLKNANVLPFRPIQSNDNVKLPNHSRLSSSFNSLNNNKLSRESMQIPQPFASTFPTEDNLNDSLENKVDSVFLEDLKGPSSETKIHFSSQSFDTTSIKDSVVTYDKESKHIYFGYTPKQPGKNSKLLENGSHKVNFDFNQSVFYTSGQEQVPSVQISEFDAPSGSTESKYEKHDYYPLFSSSLNEQHILFEKEPYIHPSHRGKDIVPLKNNVSIKDWQSLSVHPNGTHDFSDIEMTQDYKRMNLCQAFKLSAESINEQPLQENNKAFFLEISCDSKNVSSDLPKKSKKNSTLSIHSLKKSQRSSPFKAKVLKSRILSSKDGDKAASKACAILKNKEKKKFLPKKLSLNKSRMTDSIVYHRNPYASMNICYDEHWIEKQEVAFTSWLNFILTPNEESESVEVDSAKLWVESIKENYSAPAPTKEELSLKAYTAVKSLNMLRNLSSNLYQSEKVVAVIKKIEKEVELNKLKIRKDRAIQADLGIKKDILDMILSYNTLWLRIGLETIYGEVINLQNNSDVLALSRFIVYRFLQNPDIASKYSHPGVINYYKKGYEDAIQRFILKKFLLLVYFLDTAKNNHLIKHDPCLFNKNAKYKSSRKLLLVFSREYLSGEGDITKHLRYLGYEVTYEQTALEEFDYSVRNIATDLRCGLRLGRVVELLLQDWTISKGLRINTLNRLTKIHNNDVILKALKNASIEIENNIEAKHITDGDREKTLDLLWQIIFKTEISQLINTDLLKKENAFLLKSLKLRADFAAYNALRRSESVARNEINILKVGEFSTESELYKQKELLQLLLKWCQNVCAHYNIRVYNFTSSFSDGVALCLLLHHYLPNVLPYDSIKLETSRSYYEHQMRMAENDDSCPFKQQNDQQNSLMEKLLKNERDNLSLVFQKFQEVGNIPVLCTPSNLSNTMPDEKVMITLLSYINIRLLDLSSEIRAARTILHAWKKYKLRKYHQRLKVEILAVKIIQRTWRTYCMKKTYETHYKAALKIQSFWRMHQAQKILIGLKCKASLEWQNQNAVIIQAAYRRYLLRKKSAVTIQSFYRMHSCRQNFLKMRKSVIKIQRYYTAYKLMCADRQKYAILKKSIIKFQALYRGWHVRKNLTFNKKATIIQSYFRKWKVQSEYKKLRKACVIVQERYRAKLEMEKCYNNFIKLKTAAIKIQAMFRCHIIRKRFKHIKSCVIKIQSCFRMIRCSKTYCRMRKAAVVIQRYFHLYKLTKETRKDYLHKRSCLIILQSRARAAICRRRYLKQKKACILLQSFIRMSIHQQKYLQKRDATVKIQRYFKNWCLMKSDRLKYNQLRKLVIFLQSKVRAKIVRKRFLNQKRACILIQSCSRMYAERKKYVEIRSAIICIQRFYRNWKITQIQRTVYIQQRQSVIFLQSKIRSVLARKSYLKQKKACTLIQSIVHMNFQQKKYLQKRKAAVQIQRYFKNWCLMKSEKDKYNQLRKIVIFLQSKVRAKIAWKRFLNQKRACILIQSCSRMYAERKRYVETRNAILCIQRFYRNWKITQIQRTVYIQQRQSAIFLQSKIRSVLVRKAYLKQKKACTLIQSVVRMNFQQRKYLQKRKASIQIQKYFKNWCLMKSEKNKYNQLRKTVIFLQSKARAKIVRKRFLNQKKAAIFIQSYSRMHSQRKNYVKICSAIICIQRFYRNQKIMQVQRTIYIQQRQSIIFLQSKVRSVLTRKLYLKQKKACTLIQSIVRMNLLRRKYLHKRSAAIQIQSYFKSWCLMKFDRDKYNKLRQTVIFLQSKFRAKIIRKRFLNQKKAAILIQSYNRMHYQRKKYVEILRAVICIQRFYRNQKIAQVQQSIYIQQRQSVIFLQSKVRCVLARKTYMKQKKACTLIQSIVRMYIQRKIYLKFQQAAVVLQKNYRSWKLMQLQHSEYLKMRKAAIVLQSALRSAIARRKYFKVKHSATLIQTYFRSWRLMKIEQNSYARTKKALIVLQSKVRSWLARKKFIKAKEACVLLQSYFRMHIQKKKYCQLLKAAIILQRFYRNKKVTKIHRDNFLKMKKTIIFIQSKVRCAVAREKYLKLKRACITIQSFARMFIEKTRYNRTLNAVLVIQRWFKNYKISAEIRARYLSLRKSCIILQSYVRMHKYREQFTRLRTSAFFIQRKYRAILLAREVRQNYLQQKEACVRLQTYVRMVMAVQKFKKLRLASVTLQSHFRGYKARKEYILMRKAVITLQAYFKSWMMSKRDRNNFLQLKSSAIAIQSEFRGYFARKKFKQQVRACVTIQAYIRGYICRKKYMEKKIAAGTLQKYIRAYICAKRAREQFVCKKKCIIITQAVIRGYLTRRHIEKLHYSATKIQTAYRSYIIRRHYIKQKESAILIQKYFRAVLLMRKTQKNYAELKYSTILIQSVFRKYEKRKEYLRKRSAVILLQAHFRKLIARNRFVKLKNSVCLIENYYLSYKMRLAEQNAYQIKKTSCIKIQALWRGYMARKKLRAMIVSASIIQKAFRSWREIKMSMSMKTLISNRMNLSRYEYLWYLCLRRSTIDFQRAARAYLLQRNKAALKIQACWRGYRVRCLNSDKKVTEARRRIRSADGAEGNKLGNRTTHSLETLWCDGGKVDISQILSALKDLDVCTSLSPKCCERLVAADGHVFLIGIVKRCNRSIAHKEIIKMTVNILLNLAKYNKTAESIWLEKETLDIMTQLMIKHRQNGEAIFSKCCSLLWIFSQDPQKAEVMKQDLKFVEQIKSFHGLCTRSLTKQKKSLLSKDVAARSLTSSNRKKHALCGKTSLIDPDWILGQNRQREFANPELAITMLFRSLNLNIKDA